MFSQCGAGFTPLIDFLETGLFYSSAVQRLMCRSLSGGGVNNFCPVGKENSHKDDGVWPHNLLTSYAFF